jgi:hypothetical protein
VAVCNPFLCLQSVHGDVFVDAKDGYAPTLTEHSKVFNAITAHWSRKTSVALKDTYKDSDVADCGMSGSHAATLERLCAWEGKLYEEVKVPLPLLLPPCDCYYVSPSLIYFQSTSYQKYKKILH